MTTGDRLCPYHGGYLSICGCDLQGPTTIESKFVTEIPKEAGDLVSTCEYQGNLIVACQYAIFRLEGDTLVQIKFKL